MTNFHQSSVSLKVYMEVLVTFTNVALYHVTRVRLLRNPAFPDELMLFCVQ